MRTSPIAAMIFSLAFSAAADSQRPGMSPLTTSGERALTGHVMYPATDGRVEPFAGSAVWRGTTVQTGTAPTDGVNPWSFFPTACGVTCTIRFGWRNVW